MTHTYTLEYSEANQLLDNTVVVDSPGYIYRGITVKEGNMVKAWLKNLYYTETEGGSKILVPNLKSEMSGQTMLWASIVHKQVFKADPH